jgi:hypothetical protein
VAENRISRRDFLRFMGAGAAALGLGVFGFNSFFGNSKFQNFNNNGQRVSAQSAGSWSPPQNQPLETSTVHAALLAGGKVLWIMGSGNMEPVATTEGPFRHGIWNPDGSFGSTNTLSDDLFCCGMTTLANGNILLAGGTLDMDHQTLNGKWHGGKFAYEADFSSGTIGNRTEMAAGRWYPTCITLPDGKVFVVQGWDEYGCNNRLVEYYDPSSKSWQVKLAPGGTGNYCVGNCATAYYPEAGSPCFGPGTAPYLSLYPRFHLMPSGLLASVGAELDDRVYDPNTYKWVWSGKTIKRHYGTSVLLPLQNIDTEKGKILVCGGSPQAADPATKTAEIAEPSGTGLSRRSISSMQYARKHLNPVILPTGQIAIFGGNLQAAVSPVLYPEVFNPENETWTTWPAASVPRMYHSVALLLHDGRVWTAGSTPDQFKKEVRVEVFNPWYTSETRPTISGDPTGGAYGNTITIPTPNAADITKVSLIKVSAATHHYNTDQRLIWLQIQGTTSSSVTVKAPINNKLAPPGYYLIHVLNNAGVPSVGKFIKLPGSADNSPPPSDTVAPNVAVTSPANGTTISGPSTGVTVTVAGTASDNSGGSGVQKVEVKVGSANQFKLATATGPGGSGDWSTWSASDTVTTEGNHTVTARATDVAGNIKDTTITVTVAFSSGGGTTYTSIYSVAGSNNYAKLYTGSIIRAGELMHKTGTINSALIGQPVKRVNVILKKSGNPTGTISIVVRKVTGDSIIHTFGTIEASTLTTIDKTFTLEPASSYTIAANDRLLVEWNGTASSTDQVWVKKSASSTTGGFDGENTKWTQYVTAYSNQGGFDLAGEWFKLT